MKNNTSITNINALYSLRPNDYIVVNPLTQKPMFRRNINFVKFVKPNTPNTLTNKLNKTKINNKTKKAGNATRN